MIILSLRTDKPEAELGLFEDSKRLNYIVWEAHRSLAETIHHKIDELLSNAGINKQRLEGIICFKGPGSFTGLRIGMSVANALAYSNQIPIVAKQDPQWLESGIADLLSGQNDKVALPEYGGPAKITKPRK